MDKDLQLDVVTPDKIVLNQRVGYVSAPGVMGEFGILPNHADLLSALSTGFLVFEDEGKTKRYAFVSGGVVEVSGGKVTVLADAAERAESIDVARAEAALKRAEKRLASKSDDIDYTRAVAAMRRATVRIEVASLVLR